MLEFNETLMREEFGSFSVVLQSYYDDEKEQDIFNVSMEYNVDESFTHTLDMFEDYDYLKAETYYYNIIDNIRKVGCNKV